MKFVFYHLTQKLLTGIDIFRGMKNAMYSVKETEILVPLLSPEVTFEVKSIDEILGKEFSLMSFYGVIESSFERGIQMKVLVHGETHCCYFITVGPINDFLPYHSFDVIVSDREDDGKDMDPRKVPAMVKGIRDFILSHFLKT